MLTQDGQLILIQRSKEVAEAQDLIDVPGGHPEPEAIGIQSLSGTKDEGSSDFAAKILREIVESVSNEVHEEVNIPLEKLEEPRLLGIVLQGNSGGCPSAAFLVQCHCSSEEVKAYYAEGPKDEFETTALILSSLEDALSPKIRNRLTPAAEGCLTLYNTVTR